MAKDDKDKSEKKEKPASSPKKSDSGSESITKSPKTMTTKKLANGSMILIAIIMVLKLVFHWLGNEEKARTYHTGFPTQDEMEARDPAVAWSTNIVASAKEPSDEILLERNGVPYRLEPTIMSDSVGYTILWRFVDGRVVPETLPARDKRPPGWQSTKPAEGHAAAARFQLEPGSTQTTIHVVLKRL